MPMDGYPRRRTWVRRLVPAMLWLAICPPVWIPALAQTPPAAIATDPERVRALDALFKGLKAARSDDEADELVGRIWEIWTRAGRPDVDRFMEEGMGYLTIRHLGAARERFTLAIENVPSEENPRTGKITALSVIAALRGLVAPLKVGT